ncbi:MAG: alcohol dehydrogenase catalytic domain-containing protein, partial [Rhodoferax sp.]|nr:alcohol dehydrogenase catalytic domain-containing protein [Rhodoferax sp.]
MNPTMHAIQYAHYGAPEVLQLATLPLSAPGPGEVRVRMLAAGLAPFDTKLRAGLLRTYFQLAFPKVPGRDGTGVIDQIGADVAGLQVGDPVCVVAAQLAVGTCAQALVCPTGQVVA